MIKVVTSAERHTSNREWIHSEFSFSFADYDDPSNAHFGALLAHNDNELKPEQGMHEHPHHDLEILTYVVSGVLRHQDDLGNHADLQASSVQMMSAGTGINHSETNPSADSNVRFLQIWLLPDRPGMTPKWDARFFPEELKLNHLLPVASGTGDRGALKLGEEVTVYLSKLQTNREIRYPQEQERRTHIYLVSGNLEIACEDGVFQLQQGDAARIRKSCDLTLKGTSSGGDAEFILIDLP
ncbi:pirin family protein [Paenibacillus sp. MMS20-IR301]|uniref:pirin family protein n=1 Tax=Paenibacillus sp. MMS20-IR301 TaxID=2895946 RepID=UPI0028E6FB24|nr:pirin family protein [Paenibacillus sp. MMS20-IR301]WNS42988.1 pirin family protein [Paenibacillus sp. MMS20-IR301]